MDCTFNQDGFTSVLSSGGPYYCYDLHAATDRMPLVLQEKVLSMIVGETKAKAWSRLLTDLGFESRSCPGVKFHYNTGQPMGAYSS